MIFLQNNFLIQIMKKNLPLSWSHSEIGLSKFNWINLSLSGMPWVYSADVSASYEIEELYDQLDAEFPNGFLLRGCNSEFARYFAKRGHELIRTGAEGIVHLDELSSISKSVLDLVDRGSKKGRVEEISLNESNCRRVSSFIEHTPYGAKPHLIYLFNNNFDSNTRCFVVSTQEDEWLGVLTVSISSENSCHTEMILRKRNAPVGIMEHMLYSVMNIYRNEGYKYFSLGEVPFITPKTMEDVELGSNIKLLTQQHLIFKIGHIIRYAFNYKGLYDFKNKFNPTWKPVYICAAPKLQFRALLDMFCETGYLELSRSELMANIRTYSKLSSN